MKRYLGRECVLKRCNKCNEETCHDYIGINKTVPNGNPDIIIKCEKCKSKQYITEAYWVANCFFPNVL